MSFGYPSRTVRGVALALCLLALILSPRLAAAGDPQPGDACPPGELSHEFVWDMGPNSAGATGITYAIFCESGTWVSPMMLRADGSVGIGTTSPNAAAALDVYSTTKGLLPPRVTLAQRNAISSPPTGLVVYNTDSGYNELESYNGTAWEAVGAAALDAAGSTGQVQFNNGGDLGASANFFWDNTNARLGIGSASPGYKLDLVNSDNSAWTPNTTNPAMEILNSNSLTNEFSGILFSGNDTTPTWGGVKIGAVMSADYSADFVVAPRNAGTFAEALRVKSNGNVGIGTTAPAATLDVYGGIDISGTAIALKNLSDSSATDETNANIMLGSGTGATLSIGTAQYNTAVGKQALYADTTGGTNTAVGAYALKFNTTSAANTAVGYAALGNSNGGTNTATGANALGTNTSGSSNTATGYAALYSNSTGSNNVGVGYGALDKTTGNSNTGVGYYAGYDNTSGGSNIFIGNFPNIGVGVTTGSNNILLGYDVRPPSQTASNQLNIGNLIYATGLAQSATVSTGNVGIGTTSPTAPLNVYSTGAYGLTLTGLAGSTNWLTFRASATPTTDRWIAYLASNSTDLKFYDTVDRVTFQAGGNVGIGTTAPMDLLDVNTNTSGGIGGRILTNNHAAPATGNEADIAFKVNSNFSSTYYSARIANINTGATSFSDLAFYLYDGSSAGGTEKMRILNNGNVGIGLRRRQQLYYKS